MYRINLTAPTAGRALETPEHILTTGNAYSHLREGRTPEAILEDQSSVLRSVIKRRKYLDISLFEKAYSSLCIYAIFRLQTPINGKI